MKITGIINKVIYPPDKMYCNVFINSLGRLGKYTLQNKKHVLNELKTGDRVIIDFYIIFKNNHNNLIINNIEKI